MIKYIFIINGQSYDIIPINFDDIDTNYSTPDDNFASVNNSINTIIVNENQFINAGLTDFSNEIQKYENNVLQIYENNVLLFTYEFSFRNIKFDDFKKKYAITFKAADGIENYKNSKGTENDLYKTTLNTLQLSANEYASDIYGWIKVYNVLGYLVKQVFGTDYTLSSILFGTNQVTKDLYICQASNVILASTELIYEKSKIFPITFETLINDLRYLFNVRIYVTTDKIVRIERYETFENEKAIEFNAMSNDYAGYLTHKKEYTFSDEDLVKAEIFKSTYASQYFENKRISYDNIGKEIEYELQGYTDLTGVLTDSSRYSDLGYFFGISTNQSSIEQVTIDFPNRENYTFTSYSEDSTYQTINSNNEIQIDTTTDVNEKGTSIIQSEEFVIDNGAVCSLNDSFDLYIRKSIADSQLSDCFLFKVQIFIADTTLKNENNLWINAKISNESLSFGNTGTSLLRLRFQGTRSFKGELHYYYKVICNGELNLINDSQNAVITYLITYADTTRLQYESEPINRQRPNWLILNSDFSVEGSQTFLNYHLAFKNTVPEYQKYDRYDSKLEFDGQNYEWNAKRQKKGQSILSIDNISDFNSTGFVFTQFEKGEIETADINHLKKELKINGKYYNELSRGTEANILDFYFDGIKYLKIVGNLIMCEAIIGTDLSTLTPTITTSKYATFQVLNESYEFNNRIIVTSQDGMTINNYTVIITIAKPRFFYNGFLSLINIISLAQTQWVHNNGVINVGLGWSRYGNSTQRSVILDNESVENITKFEGQGINNTIDLSGFTSLDIVQFSSSNIKEIILEDLNYSEISLSSCNLSNFSLEQFTDLDNCKIGLSANPIDPNRILIEIDSKGWINGRLFLEQTSELNSYGLIAKANIEAKGWEVAI